ALPLDRVRRGVAAVAAAPAVVVEEREVGGQELGQRRVDRPRGRRAADQDDRRSLTEPFERDFGAVCGTHLVHRISPLRKLVPMSRPGRFTNRPPASLRRRPPTRSPARPPPPTGCPASPR